MDTAIGIMDHVQQPSWQPILTGGLADRAWAAIEAVASDPLLRAGDGTRSDTDGTLATGSAGLAIFYTYLSHARDRRSNKASAWAHLTAALDALEHTRLPPGLFEGIAGIGWAYVHVVGSLYDAQNDVVLEPIDAALIGLLGRTPWDDDYDLVSGLVGYGVYALEQEAENVRRAIFQLIVSRLGETAKRRGAYATWFTPPERLAGPQRTQAPNGFYNLGVAHGVPGVIAMLGLVGAAREAPPQTAGLLYAALAWLRAQRRADEGSCAFPVWVDPDDGAPPSRLAWCYGDAGLAAAWLVAARAAANTGWERDAIEIAHRAAARTVEPSGVVDAGLCHGAAGVAHIFNRLFQATQDETFREAARHWFERALDMGPGSLADAGLLTGRAGLALALLAACSRTEPEWDRALLLDVPERAVSRAIRPARDRSGS